MKPSQIITSSPEESHLVPWKQLGCKTTNDNGKVMDNSNTVIWAVKPQIFETAVKATIAKEVRRRFHISIMAGVTMDFFSQTLRNHFKDITLPVARVMPNIGMKVGAGCSVYTVGSDTTNEENFNSRATYFKWNSV